MIAILSNLTKAKKLLDKTCYHLIKTILFIAALIKNTAGTFSFSILSATRVIKSMAISHKPFSGFESFHCSFQSFQR